VIPSRHKTKNLEAYIMKVKLPEDEPYKKVDISYLDFKIDINTVNYYDLKIFYHIYLTFQHINAQRWVLYPDNPEVRTKRVKLNSQRVVQID
jgi:hypothetical protein